MTVEKERYARLAARWSAVKLWCALGLGAWLLLTIAVLSTMRTPLPPWVGVLFVPLVLLALAFTVARFAAIDALGKAATASVEGARRAVNELADEIEAHQRADSASRRGKGRKPRHPAG